MNETEEPQKQTVSVLDLDFILLFVLAIIVDALDFALELGTIVSLIIGAVFVWWMVQKTGQSQSNQELQQQHTAKQGERRAAKVAAKKALRRGILVFVAELIPLVNLLPFWTIFMFSALLPQETEENAGSKEEPGQPIGQAA